MQSFGKYQLLKKLATGGMAEVWLARQTGIEGFNRTVVLKRILPHLAEDPAAAKAKAAGIASVVFDRSGARFHGKVKTFADAAREGGLQF